MGKNEYLWWVETIRQNSFRELLPINICLLVAGTICLVSSAFTVISSSPKVINDAILEICLISLAVTFIFTISLIVARRRESKQLKAIKTLANLKEDDIKSTDDELLYFYNIDKK